MSDRRAEAFAVLDNYSNPSLGPVGLPSGALAALRAALEQHRPDEYDRGFCRACHWPYHGNEAHCPAEQLAIDALLGPEEGSARGLDDGL